MGCRTSHTADGDKECQDISSWPTLSLADLRTRTEKAREKECYVYTVRTTRLRTHTTSTPTICHWGSGPNLEGGLATLCTCKHKMRAGRRCEKWERAWVVGLTSRATRNGFAGSHFLFYMMQVQSAFDAHKELFDFLGESYPDALAAKRADKNRLGDVFCPNTRGDHDWLNPTMYTPPVANHVHREVWEADISQEIGGRFRSRPLLLGDPGKTFVWNKPTIRYPLDRNSGRKMFDSLNELFKLLETTDLE